MKLYPMQDKSNQWTEKVQLNRNDFSDRELTVISWKSNRIQIPVQCSDGQKRESDAIERLDQSLKRQA